MNSMIKMTALAAALVATSGAAYGQKTSTNGGLRVQTDDGKFEFRLGARIHFDTYLFDDPEVGGVEQPRTNASTTEFRRTRLTLRGKAYNWNYILEQDFSAGNTTAGYRDVNISTKVGPGTLVIGQFKPYRSMEEMTSSNEITMMERAFSSSAGLYNGRQFQQGVGYRMGGDSYTFNNAVFNLRDAAAGRNEGMGFSSRLTFAPISSDTSTLHLGLSYSLENRNGDGVHSTSAAATSASGGFSGRRGLSQAIATVAPNDSMDAVGLEVGYTAGPLFVQAEYSMATFGQDTASDQDVNTYYVMAAFNLAGLTKAYNKGNGAFQSIVPGAGGALELTARYDFIENDDTGAEASNIIVGGNYYLNPNTRVMLNYTIGEGKNTATPQVKTEQNQLALRVQYAF